MELVPLRELANSDASIEFFSYPPVVGQLGLRTRLERGLDQTRYEATTPSQLQIAGIEPREDVVQGTGRAHLPTNVRATTTQLFVGHEVHHVPFRWPDPLHRRSDTPQ